ncbi:hypothetical protein BH23CHL8_BH23CHL8_11350 [soil metagenome]
MTGGQEPAFRRDEVLGGLPARRASTLLFAIERRTAALARRSRQSIAAYQSPRTEAERDSAFFEALAAGRDGRARPRIQDLERHAPRWADLVPPDSALRAALGRLLGQAYPLTYSETPRLRAALGLDEPAVASAYERLHGEPMAAIWRPALGPKERASWLRSRLAERLESLPPFWMAFALTFTETVGVGILALPVALAGLGVGAGLVLLVILGLVNLLTVGALSESIVRHGSMRYGTTYFGRLVGDLLGRPAALALQVALIGLSLVAILGLYIAFSSVLEGATGLPAGLWVGGLLAIDVLIVRRGRLDATIASAMVVGSVNVVIILLIALVSLPHMDPANLSWASVPLLDGQPLDGAVLGLVFGVVLVAYFGHTSAANAAKLVLEADPSGRSLVWGNVAAFIAVIGVYALTVTAIIGAVGPDALVGFTGTAITPLAEVVGPVVSVLGALFAVLAVGLGSVYFCLGLYNQVMELLPLPVAESAPRALRAAGGPSRLASDRRLRLALGVAPTVLVAIFVEILLALGAASFTAAIAFIGVLTLPLLTGVFPMLMIVAARRRGEYVPGVVLAVAGNPVLVATVIVLFLAAVFVHALFIWESPLERAAAFAAGVAMVVVVLRIVRTGAFHPRTVVEVRQAGREGGTGQLGLVSAGEALLASALPEAGSLVVTLPPHAARELLVWAHRVTPEGTSVGLAGQARIDVTPPGTVGAEARSATVTLQDGRASSVLPPGTATLHVSLDPATDRRQG